MNNNNNQQLVTMLNQCAAACNRCATACLNEKDVKMLARCIQLDIDCAQLCQLVASFVARDSTHAVPLMDECAELCNVCADECEKHSHMEHCRVCAETCRRCAELCSQFIAA